MGKVCKGIACAIILKSDNLFTDEYYLLSTVISNIGL